MKITSALIAVILISLHSLGQNFGEIKGKVFDKSTGEPVEFASVWVETGAMPIGSITDGEGRYSIKPISPGAYDVHVKDIRYAQYVQSGVMVRSNEITQLGAIHLGESTLPIIEVTAYIEPLINPDNPSKMSISSIDIVKRADAKDTHSMIAKLVPGVTQSSEGDQLYFRGARPQNIATFIDGVKIGGGEIPRVPSNAINDLTVYTGGIPASYGDITGGVIVIETKSYMDFYRESQRRKKASY